MGVYDDLKKTQVPKSRLPVIKAKKTLVKGYLFGHISNGNGIIKLDDEYAIRIVALNDKYVSLELLDYGKELQMETQSWQKVKTIEKKINKPTVEREKAEDLFE